ncbi:hypothetical protein ELK40_00565 (plasmid) [Enterobacter sp. N18-03635]|uniref:hypothetical protein n=1 Tax=Enterobacter sp. N18-03635 TaxID=2500132 RepID=UPI000FD8CA6C|nr:hypothetical protein [Enterobacter sp. N18-03635]AZV03700.1 hypothetical protein ELK40_00565 [Enterobacter sp. N18-03635]
MIYKMKKLVFASALIWSSASVLAADFSDRAVFSDGGTAETLVTFQAPADAFELDVTGYVLPAGAFAGQLGRRIVAEFEIKTKVPRYIAFAFANPEGLESMAISPVIPGTGVTNARMIFSLLDIDDLPLTSEPTTFLPADSVAGYWEITEKMVTYQKAFIFAEGSIYNNIVSSNLFPGRYEVKIKAAVYNP